MVGKKFFGTCDSMDIFNLIFIKHSQGNAVVNFMWTVLYVEWRGFSLSKAPVVNDTLPFFPDKVEIPRTREVGNGKRLTFTSPV